MSATEYEIPVAPATPSPEAPEPQHLNFLDPGAIESIELRAAATEMEIALFVSVQAAAAHKPTYGPVVLEQDAEGTYVFRDIVGAVYGAGGTPDEARAEFEAALGDHLRFLRQNLEAVDERLRRELAVLEKLFPGR
jgi:predicted RNase H-like HicB family nuclease